MSPLAALLMPWLAVALVATAVPNIAGPTGQSGVGPRRAAAPHIAAAPHVAAAPRLRTGPPSDQSRPRPGPGVMPVVPASPRQGVGRWAWPLAPRPPVVRPFSPPVDRYAAGHRGVDLAAHGGQLVLAVADGTVTHVGVVAGRGTVTVVHGSGLRSTYEPVAATVRVGDQVARSGALGRITVGPSHCEPGLCLHLGALRGTEYVDPLLLLGGGRVRLLPLR